MKTDFRLDNWFIGYVAALLFACVGAVTSLGITWYESLILPAWMPATTLVAFVWAVLFLLTVFSADIVWDRNAQTPVARRTMAFYCANALLVLLWNYLFFGVHLLSEAVGVAFITGISVVILMLRVSRISKRAAWLLIPYLVWMVLAICLNYIIWTLNP